MPRVQIDIANVRQLPVTHSATIPEHYRDEMGHMNIMWYSHLFGTGMRAFFKSIGFVVADTSNNHGSFALEVHLRYLSEVNIGNAITVHSRLVSKSLKRFHTCHIMVNETKQDAAATFEAVGSYVDLTTRRTAPIPEPFNSRFDQLLAKHSSLDWEAPVCGVMSA